MLLCKTRACWFVLLLAIMASSVFADDASAIEANTEQVSDSSDTFSFSKIWSWTFNHILQPTLNGLVYPIAKPVDYAFKNGIVEKFVDMMTFGERKNIFIYPGFNFKPGSNTMVGFNYRHRGLFLDRDYFVFQTNYYANGDVFFSTRYNKHALFGTAFFGGFRLDCDWDRDDSFIIPETKKSFVQPDSSISGTFRIGRPLSESLNWNMEVFGGFKLNNAYLPDVDEPVLISGSYPVDDRGLYQKHKEASVGLAITFDNTDVPYVPSRGSRMGINASYNFVSPYDGIRYDDLGLTPIISGDEKITDNGLNHDYVKTEFWYQHYFYFGSAENFLLSAKEARTFRKFYTDFSWEEALRVWRPENLVNTLTERRVIAFQLRAVSAWEIEEGQAPYNAFPAVNARTPLRGYGDAWTAHHFVTCSWEYRWPVDRYVDGVIFDEYALLAPKIDDWSLDRLYNSWGFGVRVRMPNMYLFRIQFGFHGLHGLNLVMTIAPEFK